MFLGSSPTQTVLCRYHFRYLLHKFFLSQLSYELLFLVLCLHLRKGHYCSLQPLRERYKEDRTRLFLRLHSKRMRSNGCKLQQTKFWLHTKKNKKAGVGSQTREQRPRVDCATSALDNNWTGQDLEQTDLTSHGLNRMLNNQMTSRGLFQCKLLYCFIIYLLSYTFSLLRFYRT